MRWKVYCPHWSPLNDPFFFWYSRHHKMSWSYWHLYDLSETLPDLFVKLLRHLPTHDRVNQINPPDQYSLKQS